VDTVAGIQRYLDPNLADVIKAVSVNGFPALDITLKPPDLLQGCTTAVSMANGQMFTVNLGQPAGGTTTTQSCARNRTGRRPRCWPPRRPGSKDSSWPTDYSAR